MGRVKIDWIGLAVVLTSFAVYVIMAAPSTPQHSAGGWHPRTSIPTIHPAPGTWAPSPTGSASATQSVTAPRSPLDVPGAYPVSSILPGTYQSDVPPDSFLCYWELADKDGNMIDNAAYLKGTTAQLTIPTNLSTAITTVIIKGDCGTWHKI